MTLSPEVINKYLQANLDQEGLARLMACELTIEYFKTHQTGDDQKNFQLMYEKIYNNLTNKNNVTKQDFPKQDFYQGQA